MSAEQTAGIGHNKPPVKAPAAEELRGLVERIERLKAEQKEVANVVRDIFVEAKSRGFNVKALRAVIALRAKDPDEVQELEDDVDVYKHALGM